MVHLACHTHSSADHLRDELLDQLLEVALRALLSHYLHHLVPDSSDLCSLSVASCLHLALLLLGEANAELLWCCSVVVCVEHSKQGQLSSVFSAVQALEQCLLPNVIL
jgi:hypothetical protein